MARLIIFFPFFSHICFSFLKKKKVTVIVRMLIIRYYYYFEDFGEISCIRANKHFLPN